LPTEPLIKWAGKKKGVPRRSLEDHFHIGSGSKLAFDECKIVDPHFNKTMIYLRFFLLNFFYETLKQ
jgi:hypothetical protein